MEKYCVFFAVCTKYLNINWARFCFKGLTTEQCFILHIMIFHFTEI